MFFGVSSVSRHAGRNKLTLAMTGAGCHLRSGSRSGRSSPIAWITQIQRLWPFCWRAWPTVESRRTQTMGLVTGSRSAALSRREHTGWCAVVRMLLLLGWRSQLTESTGKPPLDEKIECREDKVNAGDRLWLSG
uniref:Uncharacterized protein n=1 Tax=Aegilops tauschii subsp. strangulata TaxID=200361 RepID=A0A453BHR5_AEGTS